MKINENLISFLFALFFLDSSIILSKRDEFFNVNKQSFIRIFHKENQEKSQ